MLMYNNTILKDKGMRVLAEQLGLVEAERFIVLVRRETFDYTQWRQGLFNDTSLDIFLADAHNYREAIDTNKA